MMSYYSVKMKHAYKYRFYPTSDQVELLAQTFGCARFVYNSILRWRTDAFCERQEKITYAQSDKKLTAMKQQHRLMRLRFDSVKWESSPFTAGSSQPSNQANCHR